MCIIVWLGFVLLLSKLTEPLLSCTVRGDLVEALKRLYKRVDKFDGVIIETTGLADPAPVVQTFFVDECEFECLLASQHAAISWNPRLFSFFCQNCTAAISEMYSLDCVITVVDAKVILDRLADVKPEGVENEVRWERDLSTYNRSRFLLEAVCKGRGTNCLRRPHPSQQDRLGERRDIGKDRGEGEDSEPSVYHNPLFLL